MNNPSFGPGTIRTLGDNLAKLSDKDQEFATSLLRGVAKYGSPTVKQAHWLAVLADRAVNGTPVKPAAVEIGDLGRVVELFGKAARHLKHPAIVLDGGGIAYRLSVAGPTAKYPGSINVTSLGGFAERSWYGRIFSDGRYEPSHAAPAGVERHLRRFAADPVGVAGEHGKLTGACCFCNRRLDDERSTAVGYGPVCADHFGLPWGERPAAIGEAA